MCIGRCIVTLVAFKWLFSTVYFQMSTQRAWIRAGIVTLVAFVRLFSTVPFQMYPQIACVRRDIVTLVAFVCFFSAVYFKMTSQVAFHSGIFSFITFIIQRNIYIFPTFANVIISKIFIHHHIVGSFVPCLVSVSNWENGDEKKEKGKWEGDVNMIMVNG